MGAHCVCIVTRCGSVGIPRGLLGLRYLQLRSNVGETAFNMICHYVTHCLADIASAHHPRPRAAITHHAAAPHSHHPSIPGVLLLRLILGVSDAEDRGGDHKGGSSNYL